MTAGYRSGVPAMSNAISADVPDIQETLEHFYDVFTRLTNGWDNEDESVIDFSTTPTFNNGSVEIAWPTNNMASGTPKIMVGDSDTKAWFYLDTAPPGWKVYSLPDRILAIAGGTQAYNVAGGNPDSASVWAISGLTNNNENSHTHSISTALSGGNYALVSDSAGSSTPNPSHDHGGATGAGSTHTHTITSDATWRPKAAVGKVFQLDTA